MISSRRLLATALPLLVVACGPDGGEGRVVEVRILSPLPNAIFGVEDDA